jgi:hypothetical protein
MAMNRFQIMLHDLINKHKASLQMYDKICHLVNEYTSSPNFNCHSKLQSRKSFLKLIEDTNQTQTLKPTNVNLQLHSGTLVTLPVFDIKEMIISMLMDNTLMTESNFAKGYNVLTGDVDMMNSSNQKYGEVHTGEAWLPAQKKYCDGNEGKTNMPVALIVFGDKSHTDLHGALLLTPIIFTMTLFNQLARNNTKFWRRIGYIPNLSHGKGTADRTSTRDKIQDEHTCLSCAFQSLCRISKDGGFNIVVLGDKVHIQVWIYYFIGDTKSNNKWLGRILVTERESNGPIGIVNVLLSN